MKYTHKGYVNLYKKVMTKAMALEIKELRGTCSWRMVATRFGERHPDLKVIKGNQPDGMELCNAAQEFLNEEWE
jgi:hypothetical protein